MDSFCLKAGELGWQALEKIHCHIEGTCIGQNSVTTQYSILLPTGTWTAVRDIFIDETH